LNEAATPVQALTVFGSGYWIMTPLKRADDSIIFINRGFVPADAGGELAKSNAAPGNTPQGAPVTIVGLLRLSEPGGGFLRRNDPSANRWYSRDVAAMAKARGLESVAPYFIDADRASSPGPVGRSPLGGLTVISFYNNHLVYAITWYTLALMIPVALWLARRDGR
jgi:surfeit locus 1 family protein